MGYFEALFSKKIHQSKEDLILTASAAAKNSKNKRWWKFFESNQLYLPRMRSKYSAPLFVAPKM
jgi:hypothetical protein